MTLSGRYALLALAFLTGACTATGEHLAGPDSCRSCFLDLPVQLTPIAGTSPQEKRIERDLTFVDARGLVWKAEAGDTTDGASIPEIFVPLVGDRFEPDFLPAAVVHDRYTDKKNKHRVRTWWSTARMFYEAMLANHTPPAKAKLMYYAVFTFGPHWGSLDPGIYCGPNCVNLPAAQAKRMAQADKARNGLAGLAYVYQPPAAAPSDLAEIEEMRDRIAAGEAAGTPLGV